GVRREALDVAPLPLRVQDVERERRFAGAADAGDDGQAIERDVDVDALEVVLTGTADLDMVAGHVLARIGCEMKRRSIVGTRPRCIPRRAWQRAGSRIDAAAPVTAASDAV